MRILFFLLLSINSFGQILPGYIGMGKPIYTGERVLFDLGGTGTTPNPGATTSAPDANGLYWNNITGSGANKTVWITAPVNTLNTAVTNGLSIYVNTKPGGTFSVGDSSTNGGGYTTAVSDYVATAVQDNIYVYTGVGLNMTFVIPSGKTATIKFWGGRNASGPRILQIKKSTDGSYTQEYDAASNQTYSQAVTFTGITGTQVFNMQVKSGSTFGHISVIDITLQ